MCLEMSSQTNGPKMLPIYPVPASTIVKRVIKDPPTSHPTISKTYEGISHTRDKSQVSSRKDSALLAQLRSGHHLSLGYYRNMLDENKSNSCSRCGSTSPDTVSHWLTECAATLATRMEIFGSTDQRLQDMALEPDKVIWLARRTLFIKESS